MRSTKFGVVSSRTLILAITVAACAFFAFEASAESNKDAVKIELNKLSDEGGGCHAYFVFDNQGDSNYRELKIDLVIFKSEDIFERRFAMEVAPLDAEKRTVKLFELKKMSCDRIGSFLINGVLECDQGKRRQTDCVQRLVPSSRVDVKLTK